MILSEKEDFWAILYNKGDGWERLVWYDAATREEAREKVKSFQSDPNKDFWVGFKFRIVHYQKAVPRDWLSKLLG